MRIKQEIYDALVKTRDDAFRAADEAQGAYEGLEDEYDRTRERPTFRAAVQRLIELETR